MSVTQVSNRCSRLVVLIAWTPQSNLWRFLGPYNRDHAQRVHERQLQEEQSQIALLQGQIDTVKAQAATAKESLTAMQQTLLDLGFRYASIRAEICAQLRIGHCIADTLLLN